MEDSGKGQEAGAITAVLSDWKSATAQSRNRVYTVLYQHLHMAARRHMSGESRAPMFEPAALVNEAYVRLVQLDQINWQGRSHFLAMASRVMRQVLIDFSRRRDAAKRLEDVPPGITLDFDIEQAPRTTSLEMLEAGLRKLEELMPMQAQVVEARFFAGMSIEETAEALELSPATVKRAWASARGWLLLYFEGQL